MDNPYLYQPVTKICNTCLFDNSFAVILDDGECEYCKLHKDLEKNAIDWSKTLEKIRNSKGKYNCLIGISGGIDSSTLLYAAVRKWGLRPLVIHFNNNYNSKEAKYNMKSLIDKLGVDFIMYRTNQIEYDDLNEAFLEAGLPDADIPNDIAMAKLMYETARKYGIKWILNGHDFRTEGSTPKLWTYMDAKYLHDVYQCYTGEKLENYPLYTFWDQIMQGILGIKQVRPFHDKRIHNYREQWEQEMKELTGFKWYGAKHAENIYTEFIGSAWLPKVFGIDKRIVYLSARVRSGKISRAEALAEYCNNPEFDKKLPDRFTRWIRERGKAVGDRMDYDRYDFAKYKWLIYILMKLGIVPYTFYKKYT